MSSRSPLGLTEHCGLGLLLNRIFEMNHLLYNPGIEVATAAAELFLADPLAEDIATAHEVVDIPFFEATSAEDFAFGGHFG